MVPEIFLPEIEARPAPADWLRLTAPHLLEWIRQFEEFS